MGQYGLLNYHILITFLDHTDQPLITMMQVAVFAEGSDSLRCEGTPRPPGGHSHRHQQVRCLLKKEKSC